MGLLSIFIFVFVFKQTVGVMSHKAMTAYIYINTFFLELLVSLSFYLTLCVFGTLWTVCVIIFQEIFGLTVVLMIYKAAEVIWIFCKDAWTDGHRKYSQM